MQCGAMLYAVCAIDGVRAWGRKSEFLFPFFDLLWNL